MLWQLNPNTQMKNLINILLSKLFDPFRPQRFVRSYPNLSVIMNEYSNTILNYQELILKYFKLISIQPQKY